MHDHTNTTTSGPADEVRRQWPPEQLILSATTRRFSYLMRTLWRVARPSNQPSASRHSPTLRRRQVNMGVSRRVKQLALVSRISWIRSRNSEGLLVSKATTNSWSSRPNEYVVCSFTERYFEPMRKFSSIISWRCSCGRAYHSRVLCSGQTKR